MAVQALESLQNIMQHARDKDIQGLFCSICQHLRPLINDVCACSPRSPWEQYGLGLRVNLGA